MRRLAIALAVLVGGLTAVPGTAGAAVNDIYVGEASNCWVTYDEADGITRYVTTAWGYHGGALRTNVLRADPYEGGPGCSPGRDVQLGVRYNDGSLGRSYVSATYHGLTPWYFSHYLSLNP